MTMDNEIFYAIGGLFIGAAIMAAALLHKQGALKARTEEQANRRLELEQENKSLQADLRNERESAIKLQTEQESSKQQIEAQKETLKQMEQLLLDKFKNISNDIVKQNTSDFKTQSQETLSAILNPLKEDIVGFRQKVDASFGQQATEQATLKGEIMRIVEVHEKMTFQAENLANAIKGDSKVQGDWGEYILEKLLEDAGLHKDIHYTLQGEKLNLKHPEDGTKQKPDVLVNLPEGKHIVIDSKVSLKHYERFWSETDPNTRAVHLDEFVNSVKVKVSELSKTRYQDIYQISAPELIVMFMPIEGAYILALQHDRELQRFAWDKNVAIVGATNLFATLKTISSLWRLVAQNQNAQEIAKQGAGIYDKIAGIVEELQTLDKNIETLGKTRENLSKKLSGRGGLISKAKKLKEYGVKTSKTIPVEFIESENFEEDNNLISISNSEQKTGTEN